MEDLGYSPHTIKCYLSDVQSFLLFLTEKEDQCVPLDEVGSKHIQAYLRKTQKGKAKTTRNRRLMSLRTFFKSLVKAEELTVNPAKRS